MENHQIKHWWLYVLKLEDDKWYVGITSRTVKERFDEHKAGFASAAWTREHKPVEIFDTKDLGGLSKEEAELFEKRVTRKYISKYGLNNVRGGDMTMTKPYISRFGNYYLKDDWEYITTIVFLLLIIAVLLIKDQV